MDEYSDPWAACQGRVSHLECQLLNFPLGGNRLNMGIQEQKTNAILRSQQDLQGMIPDGLYMEGFC